MLYYKNKDFKIEGQKSYKRRPKSNTQDYKSNNKKGRKFYFK